MLSDGLGAKEDSGHHLEYLLAIGQAKSYCRARSNSAVE